MKCIGLLIIFAFFCQKVCAETVIHCAHAELCKMLNLIALENKISDIKSDTLVNISGDPHEYEPSASEIKSLISAPILLSGPSELNPWIKKINFQRSKSPANKTISLFFIPDDYKFYANSTGEIISHFWLYPKVYCSLKSRLVAELAKLNYKIQKVSKCDSAGVEHELKSAMARISSPIILTHNALLPLLLDLRKNESQVIVAVKGSGHHEEATTAAIKKMYDALKAPQVIWVIETGINIPSNIKNKIRPNDKIVKIDTAMSQDKLPFAVLMELAKNFKEVAEK